MAEFKDYRELADRLTLPINGKSYVIPAVGLADGIRYDTVIAARADDPNAPTLTDEQFYRTFLGTAYDEMLADNVEGPAVERAAMTALADHQRGRAIAEVMWATGGNPKAVKKFVTERAPNRAARRSRSGAAAGTTKKPASTSGTKPPLT